MRLIDADELKKHIRRCDDSATRATFDFVDEDDIDDAPTVDVLDKIRDEIDKQAWAIAISDTDRANGMWDAYRIIDKYKGE